MNIKNRYNSVFWLLALVLVINSFMLGVMINSNMMYRNVNLKNDNNVSQIVNINSEEKINKININTCSYEALHNLPGIGEIKTNEIIKNRPYQDIFEIKKVIGDVSFNKIQKYIGI